jgi:AraC-like DNA-binding protein
MNAQIGLTFYGFVNGYRVREVQRQIKSGDARALKMLALALDAGFASKSTFNQAFKKHTNQTPSDSGEQSPRSLAGEGDLPDETFHAKPEDAGAAKQNARPGDRDGRFSVVDHTRLTSN